MKHAAGKDREAKAKRVAAPLPHPSWHPAALDRLREKRRAIGAEEFWERLGI